MAVSGNHLTRIGAHVFASGIKLTITTKAPTIRTRVASVAFSLLARAASGVVAKRSSKFTLQ